VRVMTAAPCADDSSRAHLASARAWECMLVEDTVRPCSVLYTDLFWCGAYHARPSVTGTTPKCLSHYTRCVSLRVRRGIGGKSLGGANGRERSSVCGVVHLAPRARSPVCSCSLVSYSAFSMLAPPALPIPYLLLLMLPV
jgi:hypothetical protein